MTASGSSSLSFVLAKSPSLVGETSRPLGPPLRQGSVYGPADVAGKLAGNSAQRSFKAVCFGVALLSTRKSVTSVKAKPARRGGGGVAVQDKPPVEAANAATTKAARLDGEVGIEETDIDKLATAAKAKPGSKQSKQIKRELPVKESGETAFAGGLSGGESAFSSYNYNFDPLGLSEKFPGMLPWFRESELKHGRIAMLGFVGLVAPPILGPLPLLPEKCAAAGSGGELMVVEAHNACIEAKLPFIDLSPMFIMLLAAGSIEIVTTALKVKLGWGLTIENAGDYPGRQELGDHLKQTPKDEYSMDVLKLQEIKNARLGMIGFAGAITQAALTAHGFPWTW